MIALVYADRETLRCDDGQHQWMEEGFVVHDGPVLIRNVCLVCEEKGPVIRSEPAPRRQYPFNTPPRREQN